MSNPLEIKTVYVHNRQAWRDWLQRNHDMERSGIWLVYHKKGSGRPSLEYNESVEEALCFGWIDCQIRKLDEHSYARKFTPRKLKSRWAESNRKRVARLIESGSMTPAGQQLVDYAKTHGLWDDPPESTHANR